MPARPTLRERFNYAFDKTLSHGPTALIGWLGLATFILIVIAIAVIMVGRGAQGATGLPYAVTNPKKSAMVTFAAQDKIIVVAES